MTTIPTPQVVSSYLAQLESALAGIDPAVRADIVAGIREELDGLDTTAAALRIDELGDPEFIAAGARGDAPPPREFASGRAWTIVASLLVMLGGFVIPFLGAVAGLVLVALSPAWTRRQKVIAFVAPVALTVLVAAIATFVTMWTDGVHGPGIEGYNDLLLPTFADVLFNSLLFLLLFFFVDGIWLLLTARRNARRLARASS